MRKYTALLILTYFIVNSMYAQSIQYFNQYLSGSNQVLYVTTANADVVQGTMVLYERKNTDKPWRRKDSFAIVVGRAGLAKDPQTAIPISNILPVKKEGDGKSPAGIFKLGDVFSYHPLNNLHMPFVQVDTNFYCVDDANSAYYNTLIVKDTATAPFNSFEYMKRKDELYEYGVWVLYNSDPVTAGNGSCIFIHIWRDEHNGTAGCTAMSKENILKLIHWLDKKKSPVLLQVVSNE
jgi:L,D-peptidoglycan transpeptidase YkuD (ErfK/YbiS/YcfS/YnhG family)